MNRASIISKMGNVTDSLIHIKNKSGPRTEPCGTPYVIEALLEI